MGPSVVERRACHRSIPRPVWTMTASDESSSSKARGVTPGENCRDGGQSPTTPAAYHYVHASSSLTERAAQNDDVVGPFHENRTRLFGVDRCIRPRLYGSSERVARRVDSIVESSKETNRC